jgi:putative transposase
MYGALVSQVLDRVLGDSQRPRSITVDHGTEFQSRAVEDWAYRCGVQLDFIRPGKPVEMRLLSRLTDASVTSV